MKFFQKIFRRKAKDNKRENESWYNNAHEQKQPRWMPPEAEGGAMSSPNGAYYTESKKSTHAQR